MFEKSLNDTNDLIYKKIGEKISAKRKQKRRKINTISKKLNISIDFLSYIEEGSLEKIPKHVPVMGFVKSYAKFLEIDISDELNEIDLSNSLIRNNGKVKKNKYRFSKEFIFFFISFVLVLIFLFFFGKTI